MRLMFRLAPAVASVNGGTIRGARKLIVRETGLAPDRVGKMLAGRYVNFSRRTLEKICTWPEKRGYKGDLPDDLFEPCTSSAWEYVAESRAVILFVGGYTWPHNRVGPFIHEQDNFAANHIGGPLNDPSIVYVPFVTMAEKGTPSKATWTPYAKIAQETLDSSRCCAGRKTLFFVGSQKVNYALELVIGELFTSCKPFSAHRDPETVPFYLYFGDGRCDLPSMFGGCVAPKGAARGRRVPTVGLYHYDLDKRSWDVVETTSGSREGGMIVVSVDQKTGSTEIALLGMTANGTEAMAAAFVDDPDRFWPAHLIANESTGTRRPPTHQLDRGVGDGRVLQISVCDIKYRRSDHHRVVVDGCNIVRKYVNWDKVAA
ncbi:MAG: hypothetical protein CMJ18_11745 [Phycisphaeraceae bacterium]|nr:hypothetical protein [Phycisphaeraceae bacterium]